MLSDDPHFKFSYEFGRWLFLGCLFVAAVVALVFIF